jgi:hypothetical protein
MARPSKLSPAQWEEVARRVAEGEGARALAREFGVDEAAIRRRVSPQTPQVRSVAAQLAEAQTALAALPVPQQHLAVSLADKLRNISMSYASAAELGAKTAHRFHALANAEAQRVDDSAPLSPESTEALKGIAVLTKLANDALVPASNLLAANKETVQKLNAGDEDKEKAAPVRERLGLEDWKKAHGIA